jgi:POT family proton-dependent oligopeptide transporter
MVWVILALSISQIIGGILGDLLIGNRNTTIIGSSFIFISSTLFFLNLDIYPIIPITIFVLGCGLYQSNLKALYAKLYIHESRLLDSAFLLLYIFINVGAFFGAFITGFIADSFGIEYGFLVVSVSTLFSQLVVLLIKINKLISTKSKHDNNFLGNKIYFKSIGVVIALYAVYYFLWRQTYFDMYAHYWEINFDTFLNKYFFKNYWIDNLSFIFYIILGIFLVITWTRNHYNQITKLTTATIITLIVFSLSYFLYKEGSDLTVGVSISALFIYTFAELLVEPLIDSSIAKLINHQFLAIAYGTFGLISMGIGYLFGFTEKGLLLLTENTFFFGLGGLFILSIVLLIRKYRSN